jgi:hypothetical protein
MDQKKTYTQEQYNEVELELELLKMSHEKNYETYQEALTKINKLELQSKKMLEMLKYFTDYPDSDFQNISYSDKFEMTVMAHKIAEAKQLIKEITN